MSTPTMARMRVPERDSEDPSAQVAGADDASRGRGLTSLQRSYRARVAAYSRWARPTARQEQAEAARAALWRRFERQVDPDGLLDEATRRQLAVSAARAHSARMNLARQRRRGQ